MPMYNVRGPFLGVNKAKDPSQLQPNEAQDALNVLLSQGTLRKRPGWVQRLSFASSGAVLGLYDFLRVDTVNGGTEVIHLVKAGTDLYAASEWVAESMALSMSPTELMDCETMNNKCYFCDSTMFKVTDGTTDPSPVSYNAQITPPTAPSVAASVNAGPPNGTYDYKITYYSSTWGQESPASPATDTVTVADKEVDLTSIPTSSDGRVDSRRIYRRKTSANESNWYYIHTIEDNTTTSWADDTLDNDVDSLSIAPLSYTDTVPPPRFLAQQAGVLFAAGNDKYPTRLYFSQAEKPWVMAEYLEVGTASDTDPITGLAAFQGVLVVFKQRSIWLLSGNSLDTFHLRKVVPSIGCRGHHSIVPYKNVLMFLGEDGFKAFDGANVWSVSGAEAQDPIGPDIRARNYSRDRYCVGVYDPDYSVVLWSYSSADASANDRVYAHFPEHSQVVGYPSWCPWVLGGVTYFGRLTEPSNRDRITHMGFASGSLAYFGSNADNSQPFQFLWKTGELDGAVPTRYKLWKEAELSIEPQDEESTLTVKQFLDSAATGTTIATHDQTTGTVRGRVSDSSRRVALQFAATSDQPSEIYGYMLDYEIGGRA